MTSFLRFDPAADDGNGDYLPVENAQVLAFRPRRATARSVFQDLPLRVTVDGKTCELKNISDEGAHLYGRFDIASGDTRTVVAESSGKQFFSRRATVTWADSSGIGTDFGVRFDDPLDFPALQREALRLIQRLVISSDIETTFRNVPQEYVLLSGQLLNHLAVVKAKAEALEPPGSETDLAERDAKARRLLSECGPAFRDIWYGCNDIIGAIDYGDIRFAAIKDYTERVIRPHLMGAPVFERSWAKPLGYPGDYQIMLYAYLSNQPIKTPTLFDNVIHLYFAHTFGECIRGRLDLAMATIRARMAEVKTSPETPFEMLSVGAGAAVELPPLLDHPTAQNQYQKIHLIEQDAHPLQYALENAAPSLARHGDRVDLIAFNVSFVEVFQAGRLVKEEALGLQDVIYSLGLIDYFRQPRAKKFALEMYGNLKPGGTLILCNVAKRREGCEWILECLTDWRLHYRTEADMLDMVDIPGAEITPALEPSNQMWVVTVKKPS